jgi:hypothetical protein
METVSSWMDSGLVPSTFARHLSNLKKLAGPLKKKTARDLLGPWHLYQTGGWRWCGLAR